MLRGTAFSFESTIHYVHNRSNGFTNVDSASIKRRIESEGAVSDRGLSSCTDGSSLNSCRVVDKDTRVYHEFKRFLRQWFLINKDGTATGTGCDVVLKQAFGQPSLTLSRYCY